MGYQSRSEDLGEKPNYGEFFPKSDSSNTGELLRLDAEKPWLSTRCVDTTADKYLPGLNLECFRKELVDNESELERRISESERQKSEALDRKMNDAITAVGFKLNAAIELRRGRDPIEIVKLSDATSERFMSNRAGGANDDLLLKAPEKKVFDYLKSQGLEPYIRPSRDDKNTFAISVDLFPRPMKPVKPDAPQMPKP